MIYDSHTHTTNSDGRNTLDEMCIAAIEKGVSGITITDHADMNFYESRDTLNRIKTCIGQIRQAQQKYAGQMDLLCGVELILKDEYDFILTYNANYDDTFHKKGPESMEALAEMHYNFQTFCMFDTLIRIHWKKHNVLIGTGMDHGCHELPDGRGTHCDDTPEDRNIIHMYKIYPAEKTDHK